MCLKFMHAMATRVHHLTRKVESLVQPELYDRVAKTLISLSKNNDGMVVIEPRISCNDISKMIGSNYEVVNNVMKKMSLEGHIHRQHDRIVINEPLIREHGYSSQINAK